ncbi:MAG: DNA helicase RecQ [Cytophagales bacterium]
MITEQEADLKTKLKEVFGYDSFRGTQEEIINSILSGKNTLVIMPTGAGKSLCYQLPALMREGTAIVISPLIALMKNQVDQLSGFGVNACFLNSTLSKSEITKVKKDTLEGKVRLLYVAPESLTKDENIELLQRANISFVAVDEAHCISEWGHDFRPEYRKIKQIIEKLGDKIPVVALTATATPKVQQDILKNLQIENANVYKSSFNRKNLYYEIRPKIDIDKQLIRFIKEHQGKSGIIYCISRKKVEEVAEKLKVNGVKALPYHAGLESHVRMHNQDAFLNENCDVIVATIAFGMGIDKPDVRFVIHYDAPKSVEGYYQETGRAGRDGLEGNCIMFYSQEDIVKLEKFNKDKSVTERDNARHLLMEMTAFAESSVCRRKLLLHYFGEHLEKDCGFCDNCLKPKEKFEGMEEVLLALKAVVETEQRFGVNHLIDVLRGEMNEYVESYGHDDLDIFGEGDEKNEDFWNSVFRQILIMEFLEKDVDNFGVLKITEKGKEFIKKPYPITLTKDHDFSGTDSTEEKEPVVTGSAYDEELYNQLKALRKKVAKEKNLPPYTIFQDASLEEMATTYPTKEDDLVRINGVGLGKAQKFGKAFLELIARYVKENEIITASDVVVKSSANKSKLKVYIIQQIDRKVDLEEICEAKDISPEELLSEIEQICFSGTKLNLDYYVDQVLDQEKQEEIYEYFMNSENDSIEAAVAEFGGDYSEEDLRLMRIKFLSDVAN